ncbi:hypothetical protein LZ009_14205 [Ramlibacter sp. XY19]|uniref:hypothetical protein n=1 Tax=Ramlibacter paludis TaxID=2908000 RepID=UPI0023DBB1BF|nr:hypothetical protein [Ramlibacter paludis]MCG2593931.1 hypothetical protein [Ramlibacter paludis]
MLNDARGPERTCKLDLLQVPAFLKCARRALIGVSAAAFALVSPAVSDVVACDLFDEATLSALAGGELKANGSRARQPYNGATISSCQFSAPRKLVRVTLMEYPSAAEARKEYEVSRRDAALVKRVDNVAFRFLVQDEPGMGDRAYAYRLESEQSGVFVLKGNRLFDLNFHFSDAAAGQQAFPLLLERARPAVRAAVRRI